MSYTVSERVQRTPEGYMSIDDVYATYAILHKNAKFIQGRGGGEGQGWI